MMIYKIVTIRFKPSNMRMWHYKHKEMYIGPSYKNVKTSSSILKHVMFLMQEIPVKKTLSSLHGNTQRLSMISFMNCHIKSRGYNDVKGMLN